MGIGKPGSYQLKNELKVFAQNLRRLHILYVSPEWAVQRAKKFNAGKYVKILSESNVGCIELYAKDHHGYCYYRTSTGRKYPVDVLGDMLKECHNRKIKLIAYYSVGFDNYASGLYPEWLHVNQKGDYRDSTFTRLICLNSPYRNYTLKQIEELVSQYKVDGIWLDVISVTWQGFQKIGWFGEVTPFCHCIYCRRKYKEEYGRDMPWDPDEAELIEGYRFWLKGMKSFLQDAYRLIRKHLPHAIIIYNSSGSPNDPLDSADIISVEGCAPYYFHYGFLARYGRARNKPMEILSAGAISGWNGWDQKPFSVLKLESSIGLAHGIGFTFGEQPYPDGSFEERNFVSLKKLFGWIGKMEEYCLSPGSVGEIGMLLTLKNLDAPQSGVGALCETEGIHQVLLNCHLQYDILTETKALGNYRLVIIANQNSLSDKEIRGIEKYVRSGGKVLVTGYSSLFDEKGKKRPDFGLSDCLGIRFKSEGRFPVAYIDYCIPILIEDKMIEVENRKARVLYKFFYPETIWTKGTTVLWGNAPPDRRSGYPCIVHNHYGKGECIYVGFTPGCNVFHQTVDRTLKEHWLKDLFISLVEQLLPDRILETDLPEGVEAVLNKDRDRYVLHLINYYAGVPGLSSLSDNSLISAGEVRFNLAKFGKIKKAYTIPEKTPIIFVEEKNSLLLTLPPFSISLIIVMEMK